MKDKKDEKGAWAVQRKKTAAGLQRYGSELKLIAETNYEK
jgi:hypothetical protein